MRLYQRADVAVECTPCRFYPDHGCCGSLRAVKRNMRLMIITRTLPPRFQVGKRCLRPGDAFETMDWDRRYGCHGRPHASASRIPCMMSVITAAHHTGQSGGHLLFTCLRVLVPLRIGRCILQYDIPARWNGFSGLWIGVNCWMRSEWEIPNLDFGQLRQRVEFALRTLGQSRFWLWTFTIWPCHCFHRYLTLAK